ncbi:MAG: ACT domain-containing protein [Pseudomonadota bacterium]
MNIEMVVSLIATDRPGLVRRLSETVSDRSGSWIESSMARLGGEFAGIVRISLPKSELAGFETALDELRADGITLSVRRDEPIAPLIGQRLDLKVTGSDRPGIVHEISRALDERSVSIEDLETEIFSGSMSGDKLFVAQARIVLPDGLDMDEVRGDLEDIAQDIMVDVEFAAH